MAYIGNQGGTQNFRKCDAITTSATATYNLLVGGVAVNPAQNQTIVSLNGVVQSSGDSYTIASSQITFASTLASSDVIDFILILGDTLNVGTPSDATVSLAKLTASGTKDSTTYLRGDNTFATVSGTALTGSTDNQVTTVTGANAITGEANLQFDGSRLGVNNSSMSSYDANGEDLVVGGHSGSNGMTIACGSSGSSNILFATGTVGDQPYKGRIRYEESDNHMAFYTDGASERMRIASTGTISMGTTNTHAELTVYQSDLDEWVTRFQNTNATRSYCVRTQMTTDHNDTTSDFMSGVGASTTRWKIQSNGNMENINNSYGAISDERIKENITNANSQWEDVKKLKFKNYNIINETNTQLGVIAQDLETDGMNGLVSESPPTINHVEIDSLFGTLEDDTSDPLTLYEDGDVIPEGKKIGDGKTFSKKVGEVKSKIKAVKYSVLYMKAIKCLQEAMEKIETLETSNTDLTTRLEALENA